jgi:hypothetical protein
MSSQKHYTRNPEYQRAADMRAPALGADNGEMAPGIGWARVDPLL